MKTLKRPLIRLRNYATNRRGDERLREEMQTHIAMLTEENMRVGISPADLPTFAGVTLALAAVALAASYIPALRAMRVDPITTLHSE